MRTAFTTITTVTTTLMTLFSAFAIAQSTLNGIVTQDPWIRASVPGQTNGAGYLEFKNTSGQTAALVSIKSDRAHHVELHTTVREGGVAKMREVEKIDIPANASVKLAPGGLHIMFIGLTKPFSTDEVVPVTLNFSDGRSATVSFTVRPATHMAPSGGAGGHKH